LTSKLLKKAFKADNLERSWQVIRENGRQSQSDQTRSEIAVFADDAPANLRRLQRRLSTNKFEFAPMKGVPLQKRDALGKPTGKVRPIVLAPIESRIVQRALLNVLLEVPSLARFVATPHSFGGIRKRRRVDQTRVESLSGVPAAIQSVLTGIGAGLKYFVVADISGFFTKIPKSAVRKIVGDAVNDDEFLRFFDNAIAVELANMTELRERADAFPIEDIGVAQGNSLSPLLGNIFLYDFDTQMNAGDCACIRYIDDFIIMAPTEAAANARLRKAVDLLANFEMNLALEKSGRSAAPLRSGIHFLGIEICPGLIRPTDKAQQKLLGKVDDILDRGTKTLIAVRNGQPPEHPSPLLQTLRLLSVTIEGWGKHYWFCNDGQIFAAIDARIWKKILAYLGCYGDVRGRIDEGTRPSLLGLAELKSIDREPFTFPTLT
jgi:RNA-directed DNA polymerase